jgi:hypothetical protein
MDADSSIEIMNDVSYLSEVSFEYGGVDDVEVIQDKIDHSVLVDCTEELQIGEFV